MTLQEYCQAEKVYRERRRAYVDAQEDALGPSPDRQQIDDPLLDDLMTIFDRIDAAFPGRVSSVCYLAQNLWDHQQLRKPRPPTSPESPMVWLARKHDLLQRIYHQASMPDGTDRLTLTETFQDYEREEDCRAELAAIESEVARAAQALLMNPPHT